MKGSESSIRRYSPEYGQKKKWARVKLPETRVHKS